MINLQPLYVESGTVTENGDTRHVQEVINLTIWEAMRLLLHVEVFLIFKEESADCALLWRCLCDIRRCQYALIREGESAYLAAFRKSLNL